MQTKDTIKTAITHIKERRLTADGALKYPPANNQLPAIDKVYYDESLIMRFYIFLGAMVESTLALSDENLPLYIASAKGYAQIATKTIAHNLCSCSGYTEDNPSSTFSRKMVEIVPMLLPFALSSDWEEMEEVLNIITDSLNAKNCLIVRGQHEAHMSWFTVKLLSDVFEKEIGRKPLYPNKKEFTYYQAILDDWQYENTLEVDKMVSILCELHLGSKEYHPREFSYFFDIEYSELLPYEVIIWLKVREYKGLKNPKNFSHPLMQTKIVKKLLRIDTNLPTPQGDPELKLFLEEKIQVMCPDNNVEIPEWLNTETKEEVTPVQDNNTIPDDFMK
jgi:hypothetical protein